MSASDDIKRTLVAHFQAQGVDTRPADWKRRAKTMVGDYVVRTFDNASANLAAHAVTVDEEDCDFDEACIWETGPIGFGIGHEEGRTFISFVPMTQWHRTGAIASIDDYALRAGDPGNSRRTVRRRLRRQPLRAPGRHGRRRRPGPDEARVRTHRASIASTLQRRTCLHHSNRISSSA